MRLPTWRGDALSEFESDPQLVGRQYLLFSVVPPLFRLLKTMTFGRRFVDNVFP